MTDLEQHGREGPGLLPWVVALDVLAKVVLVLAVARVAGAAGSRWAAVRPRGGGTR